MTNKLVLSDLTIDFAQFSSQFENHLASTGSWKGNLTTQTSQTLVELVSTVGAFMQGRLIRAREDSFAETAQSDDAIRSITQMQGLRMSRKLPSTADVTITSTIAMTLEPLTQFNLGSQPFFNREQITLVANAAYPVTLFQGTVKAFVMSGLGSDLQSFMSEEDVFQVSDQDVQVLVNGTAINKAFGGLWNYRGQPAFEDLTTSDGRLLVLFGNALFGTVPGPNDVVLVKYPVTSGGTGNNQNIVGGSVTVPNLPTLSGTVLSNPTGGSDEKDITAYKNLASGSFGTYASAVTKNQYQSTVGVYPGIVDAFTQAQRDINPSALEWMNVIRVSGLTTSPWSTQQKSDFCRYMESVSMYSPRFVWQDPIAVPRTLDIDVFCFNSAVVSDIKLKCEQAIQELFAPRLGLLMTNIYESDLIEACMTAGAGSVSYVIVNLPLENMVVTAPTSPKMSYTIGSSGTLSTYSYSYGIASVNGEGEEGPPTNWVFPQIVSEFSVGSVMLSWLPIQGVSAYKIYGRRAGQIGLLGTVLSTEPLTFLDDGSLVPTGAPPNSIAQLPIRYNTLANLTLNVSYAERQQRLSSLPSRG